MWKQANVCPIDKNGDRADKANNRPATQPSCIGNIFESIVRDATYEHLQVNNILCNEQFGLRPGLSCLMSHVTWSLLHLLETLLEWTCMLTKVKDVITSMFISVKPLTLFLMKDGKKNWRQWVLLDLLL